MKKGIKNLILGLGIFALSVSLIGCGLAPKKSEEGKTGDKDVIISIAVTPVPHAEIVKEAVVPALKKQGYEVKVVEFNDYVQPNTATEEGEVDANYFQTPKYLAEENKNRNLHLVSVAEVHLEPMGVYSKKVTTLSELPDGASIAVPNDASNESRALVLLQENGLIKLGGTDGLYNLTHITENPHNFKFSELEAASLPVTLEDVDAAVINGNYALQAKLNPLEDSLALEKAEGELIKQYYNLLVVKEGNENNPKIQALKAAITSEEVKKFIEEKYSGSVIPAF